MGCQAQSMDGEEGLLGELPPLTLLERVGQSRHSRGSPPVTGLLPFPLTVEVMPAVASGDLRPSGHSRV